MQKGFSLIEIAIVLVVIGLIAGGLLASRSLTTNAQVNGAVAQFQQFDSAVGAYVYKHKYLPGDNPNVSNPGDGDGLIDMTATSGADDRMYKFTCELANFWAHLDSTAYIASTCDSTGVAANPVGNSPNVPLSKMGPENAFVVVSPATNDYTNAVVPVEHYYIILSGLQLKYAPYDLSSLYTPAITPQQAASFDKKMDDGLPDSGNVAMGSFTDIFNPFPVSPLAIKKDSAGCAASNSYGTEISYSACTPMIRMGATQGDPY